jgi:Cu2+-containing amine oxidase
MCEQCKNLQKQIDQFNRVLQHPLDPLTEQRLKAAVAEMEKRKAELH